MPDMASAAIKKLCSILRIEIPPVLKEGFTHEYKCK
jgi:hypothetical protein